MAETSSLLLSIVLAFSVIVSAECVVCYLGGLDSPHPGSGSVLAMVWAFTLPPLL